MGCVMKKVAGIAILGSSVVGCSYNAPVEISAAYNVNSSYEEKVPGKWAIWIDGSELKDNNVKPSTYACSAHKFPIDASKAFEKSTLNTFTNLVESIERVDNPIPASKLGDYGYTGQILIEGEDLDVDLMFTQGFWTMSGEAEVEFEASLSAFIQTGKVLGTTVSGSGEGQGDAGSACGGGAQMIGKGAEEGMKRILRKMGEKFSSSSKLRTALNET